MLLLLAFQCSKAYLHWYSHFEKVLYYLIKLKCARKAVLGTCVKILGEICNPTWSVIGKKTQSMQDMTAKMVAADADQSHAV